MSQPALKLHALVDRVAADGRVSAEEVLALRQTVFPDGVVDHEEAGALFALAGHVANDDGAQSAPWAEAFIEAIGDHVLGADRFITDNMARWLVEKAPRAGALATPLLLKVLDRAESAPETLAAAARAAVLEAVATAPLGARELGWVRTCLFTLAGDGAAYVTDAEVRWLFALDAATDGRANDAGWPDLFVKSVLNHVMGHRPSTFVARDSQAARRDWLAAPAAPSALGFLGRAFEGGLDGYLARVFSPGEADAFEAHYARRLAEAAEDSRLTLQEVTRIVTLVRADGKRTANETRLLEEVRQLEAAQAG